MNELVFNNNGKPATTSLIVAQIFGKNHSDVLRDIRNLHCSDEFKESNFALMVEMRELPQGGATQTKHYQMTKDGFSFLVMGYTGDKAGKFKEDFIKAFNHYEQIAKEQSKLSPAEMLLQSAQLHLENERRINKIEDKIELIEAKITTRPNYFTIVGYATLNKISCGIKLASSLGRKATKLCKSRNIPIEYIPDPRFGIVKTYPIDILEEVFNSNIAK